MVKIKNIKIKNFRSIVSLDINVDNMSIFVGLNDAGKSNILKALNLFFNGETEPGHEYRFENDYSILAPIRAKKAREVTIAITFEIPSHYKDNDDIVWEKVWRNNATPYYDNFSELNFSRYSKVPTLLSRVQYRYVPAVKSDDYFKLLLADLYESIAKEMNEELVSKSKDYSEALSQFTKQIGVTVKNSIGIKSELKMPTNQIDIFKQLIFETREDENHKAIELTYRGDGIKAMHIPAILNYIAEQDNRALGANTVPATTIWGYEEPENGIEMKKCFELAEELYGFSYNIQQFITTHSPGIYQLGEKEYAQSFYIYKDDNSRTIIKNDCDVNLLDERIGMVPIITPHIKQIITEKDQLEELLKKSHFNDIDTIFVEGITDKYYIENAIKLFSGMLSERIRNGNLRIETRINDGCGVAIMCNWAKAWFYSANKNRAIFLFDNDEAGGKAYKSIKEFKNENHNISNIFPIKLSPTDDIKEINRKMESHLPFVIEHLFSVELWEIMKTKNLVTKRTGKDLQVFLQKEMGTEKSCNQVIHECCDKEYLRDVVEYVPGKKNEILEIVKDMIQKSNCTVLGGLQNTIKEIERILL